MDIRVVPFAVLIGFGAVVGTLFGSTLVGLAIVLGIISVLILLDAIFD